MKISLVTAVITSLSLGFTAGSILWKQTEDKTRVTLDHSMVALERCSSLAENQSKALKKAGFVGPLP